MLVQERGIHTKKIGPSASGETEAEEYDETTVPHYTEHSIGGNFNLYKRGNCFKDADAAHAQAMQLFISDSKSWPPKVIGEDGIQYFRRERLLYNFDMKNIVVHGNLKINIASPDDINYNIAIKTMKREIECCSELGIGFYVIHPGSAKHKYTRERAIKRAADAIREAMLEHPKVTVLLENMAGQGDTIGSKFEELKTLMDTIDAPGRVAICLDTQHLWAAGYDITKWNIIREELDTEIGLHNIKLIHLNDSASDFGSRKDSHASIGEGTIPITVFRTILNDPIALDVPIIIESSHSDDPNNVANIRSEIAMLQKEMHAIHTPENTLNIYTKHQDNLWTLQQQLITRATSDYQNENGKRIREESLPVQIMENTSRKPSVTETNIRNEELITKCKTISKGIKGSLHLFNSRTTELRESHYHRLYMGAIAKKEREMKRLGERMKNRWKLAAIERRKGVRNCVIDGGDHEIFIKKLDGINPKTMRTKNSIEEHLRMEYYTPRWLVERMQSFWKNGIDLDPTSSATANEIILAKQFYTKEDDTYTTETNWRADTLYMNPPFDKNTGEKFIQKFISEWENGNIGEALILIPATGGQWLDPVMERANHVLIPRKRMTFWNKEAKGLSPRYSTYLLYFGRREEEARVIFERDFHFLRQPHLQEQHTKY